MACRVRCPLVLGLVKTKLQSSLRPIRSNSVNVSSETRTVRVFDPFPKMNLSAIGTFWYVNDVVILAFFMQFCRLLDQGLPKAQALQRTHQLFSSGVVRLSCDD